MNRTDFIYKIGRLIVAEGKARGYSVFSPIIAQAIIESRYGESELSDKFHNYFGLKCGRGWKGGSVNMKTKEEYTPGKLTSVSGNFRTFRNMEEGVKGYFDFISTKRYQNLKTAKTPLEYCTMIKADGYATSSSYVNTLMNCIAKHNLTEFDGNDVPAFDVPQVEGVQRTVNSNPRRIEEIAIEVIRGKWGNGLDRVQRLGAAGYNYYEVQKAVNKILRGLK